MGNFECQYVTFAMLLLNEHHASSEKKTSSHQETCWPLILEATCNNKFLLITSLFVQMNAQVDRSRSVTTYIKIYIKMFLHVLTNHHQGAF